MAATTGLTIYPGIPRRDWCETCLTTAVISFNLYTFGSDGPIPAGTFRSCQRCNGGDDAPR
jgi:hypothetical protein